MAMNTKTNFEYELWNADSDDINDILIKVEKSFAIRFEKNELSEIRTFGELCDHIISKVNREEANDCTGQQAYYKLRNAIATTLQIDSKEITTSSVINEVLPRASRRSRTKQLERELGFKLNILRPPYWITGTLGIICIVSIVGLFFDWKLGLFGILLSSVGIWLANNLGIETDLETVGEMAKKISQENYVASRRNPLTFNKNEIHNILTDWFSDHLNIDKSKLTREARFVK
jgi:acyl carrier protein